MQLSVTVISPSRRMRSVHQSGRAKCTLFVTGNQMSVSDLQFAAGAFDATRHLDHRGEQRGHLTERFRLQQWFSAVVADTPANEAMASSRASMFRYRLVGNLPRSAFSCHFKVLFCHWPLKATGSSHIPANRYALTRHVLRVGCSNIF